MNLYNKINDCSVVEIGAIASTVESVNTAWEWVLRDVKYTSPASSRPNGSILLAASAAIAVARGECHIWHNVLNETDRAEVTRITQKIVQALAEPRPVSFNRKLAAVIEEDIF